MAPSAARSNVVGRSAILRLPDFRRLATALLMGSVGNMGEIVVLGWLSLELTNSPFLVGVAMGARALPLFFVGVPAGALADRAPRHRLLMATAAGQALTATALGLLTLSGTIRFAHILLLCLATGTVRAIEHAARQSYVHDVVGPAALMQGLAILGVAMRTGWLVGSLGLGVVIAQAGTGAAYLVVAVSYLASVLMLRGASAPPVAKPSSPESLWQGVTSFITAMRTDRVLPVLMMLTAGAEILGFSHQVLLPSLARDVLRVGPEGLGVMSAARAVGGIVGLFAVSMHGRAQGSGVLFLGVLLAFGASLMGLAVAPHLVGFAGVVLVVILANAMGALADLLAQGLMQLSVPAHLRGRAGGAWVVAIGLAPVGQLQIGALASLFGVSVALGASGAGLIVLVGAAAFLVPRIRRL